MTRKGKGLEKKNSWLRSLENCRHAFQNLRKKSGTVTIKK
jgi:hypothetical protein